MTDVFISYSSQDRERVRPFVDGMRAAGLAVWWDQDIERGRWDLQIEEKQQTARTVVGFLTAVAMRSNQVHEELRRAYDAEKLIPVRLDKAPVSHAIGALIGLVQNYFITGEDPEKDAIAIQRLYRACGSQREAPVAAPPRTTGDEVAHWLSQTVTTSDLAWSLTIASIENAPLATIEAAANFLEKILDPPPDPEGMRQERRPFVITHRAHRLERLRAESFRLEHDRLKRIEVECVRFVDPERAGVLLDYVWGNLDGIQQPLCEWLAVLAQQASPDLRLRTGLAIGRLAQRHFHRVFEELITPLALDDAAERRQTADIALSVAALELRARAAALQKMRDWSADWLERRDSQADRDSGSVRREGRAAAEFCCGYTGANFPDEMLPVLRRIVRQDKHRATRAGLADASQALQRTLRHAAQEDDSSLVDLVRLFAGLADWLADPEDEADKLAAGTLFLCAAECLPVTVDGADARFCLKALLAESGTITPFARAFAAVLGIAPLYEVACDLVAAWIGIGSERAERAAVLERLRDALLLCVPPGRDTKRINFVFRRVVSAVGPKALSQEGVEKT